MEDDKTLGLVFLANAITLGVATKMWYVGLPFFVLGLLYLTGKKSPDDEDE